MSIGDKEASKILISAGADINQADEKSGRTPLHIAMEINNRSLVDFFFGCGASLDVADGRGLTPLHIAWTEMEEGEGSLETIIKRVGGGEVLDIRDSQGLTPLMHAYLYGNLPSVSVLLKKNVRIGLVVTTITLHVYIVILYMFSIDAQLDQLRNRTSRCVTIICRAPLHNEAVVTRGCTIDNFMKFFFIINDSLLRWIAGRIAQAVLTLAI